MARRAARPAPPATGRLRRPDAAPDTPPERLGEAGATNYAFVADLTARRFRFVMGNPCEGAFRDVAFP